ncbi:MAG: hypothetical protein CL943_01605 [Candidatus Diapherotrites archaeon]|uniref:50S ribosomal protein L32e n=1 Tax=Candidatus Iainarchaeum sp. TaxID=3101447 RepID=A0A2D6M0P1_9ARCH|nr:hypothetical protein [Candidatus Diapherotrites archaeon]|tara:strand:+ start:4842 stop:5450 length:609 start_codon:yes stop_codon:yes gene_type:complete
MAEIKKNETEKKVAKKPVNKEKEVKKTVEPVKTKKEVKAPTTEKKDKVKETKDKKTEKKPVKAKAKKEKKVSTKKSKSKEVKAIAEKIKGKKKVMFRGRFGNRSIRRISNKKWQRWRKPRGIDIYFKQEDGLYPKTGYKTAKDIRGVHPSGYNAILVNNEAELERVASIENAAVMLAKTLGKRKRNILVEKADKLGLTVLNG